LYGRTNDKVVNSGHNPLLNFEKPTDSQLEKGAAGAFSSDVSKDDVKNEDDDYVPPPAASTTVPVEEEPDDDAKMERVQKELEKVQEQLQHPQAAVV